jgi:hypothetical protein
VSVTGEVARLPVISIEKHLIERWTPTGPNLLEYQVNAEDGTVIDTPQMLINPSFTSNQKTRP